MLGSEVPASQGVDAPENQMKAAGAIAEEKMFDINRGFLLREQNYQEAGLVSPLKSGVSKDFDQDGTTPLEDTGVAPTRGKMPVAAGPGGDHNYEFQVNFMKEMERAEEMVDEYEGFLGFGKDEKRLRGAKRKLKRLQAGAEGGFDSLELKSDFVDRLRNEIRRAMVDEGLQIENIRYMSDSVTFDGVRLEDMPSVVGDGGHNALIRHKKTKNRERYSRALCQAPDGNSLMAATRQGQKLRATSLPRGGARPRSGGARGQAVTTSEE